MNDLNASYFIETNVKENEKQSFSMPVTPTKASSLAFTIDLDDLNNNMLNSNKKKLNIRDSIRKFAPSKPETMNKTRTKVNEQISNREKTLDNSIRNDIYSESTFKNNSNNKINTRLNDGASFLIQRMLYSDHDSLKNEEQKNYSIPVKLSNTLTREKNINLLNQQFKENLKSSTSLLYKYSSKSSSFKSPSTNEMDSGVCDDDKSDDREYDESLLKSKQQVNFFKNTKDPLINLNKQEEENEHEIDDNVSESGTYTVGLDNVDPIAEHARKRINEIFDEKKKSIQDDNSTCSDSNSECSFSKENLDENKSTNNFKLNSIDVIQKIYSNKQNKTNLNMKVKNDNKKELTFNKSKSETLNNSPILSRKTFESSVSNKNVNQKINNQNKANFRLQSVSKNNSIKQTKNSHINHNINLINQNNTYVLNCNNQANVLLNKVATNNMLRNSNRNNQKSNSQKNSSNNIFEDAGSLKSEDVSITGSTDLSSIGSEKCKSDSFQTSTMRFNRAFALRRARLGIETPFYSLKNCKNNKQLSSSKTSINTVTKQANSDKTFRKSSISSMPENTFDRTDGGRFSLRATKILNNNLSSRKPLNLSSIPCAVSSPTHSLNISHIKNFSNKNLLQQRSNSVNYFNKQALHSEPYNEINNYNTNSSAIINSNYIRANSFDGTNINDLPNYNKYKSNASSSSNTISNASTNEDLSNLTDTINFKSLQRLSPFQLGRRIFSTKPHYMAQTNSIKNKLEENNLSSFQNNNYELNGNNHNIVQNQSRAKNEIANNSYLVNKTTNTNDNVKNNTLNSNASKSLSALDYLVLSAVHQLSFKLRCKLRSILDTEKNKYPVNNENRILIEELLPQVNILDYRNSEMSDKTISRDLSNILKNLKRIEQSLEVVNLLLESNSETINRTNNEIFNNNINNNSTNNNNVGDVESPIVDVNFFPSIEN